jgi:hypothetical protein
MAPELSGSGGPPQQENSGASQDDQRGKDVKFHADVQQDKSEAIQKGIADKLRRFVEEARERVRARRSKSSKESEEYRKNVQVIETGLSKQNKNNYESILLSAKNPPQNEDVVRIVAEAVKEINANPDIVPDSKRVQQWIMDLQFVAQEQQSAPQSASLSDAQEVQIYKYRFTQLLAEAAAQEAIRENPGKKEVAEAVKSNLVGGYGQAVGVEISPDDFYNAVKSSIEEPQGQPAETKLKQKAPKLGEGWILFDEESPQFQRLDPEVQQYIQTIHDVARNPRLITEDFVQNAVSGLVELAPKIQDRTLQEQMLRQLDKLVRDVKAHEFNKAKVEDMSLTSGQLSEYSDTRLLAEKDYEKALKLQGEIRSSYASADELRNKVRNGQLNDFAHKIRPLDADEEEQDIDDTISEIQNLIPQLTSSEDKKLAELLTEYYQTKKDFLPRLAVIIRGKTKMGKLRNLMEMSSYEDSQFVEGTLRDPNEIIRLYKSNPEGFEKEFDKRLVRMYNEVLANMDANPDVDARAALNPLYHQPVLDEIIKAIQDAEREIHEQEQIYLQTHKTLDGLYAPDQKRLSLRLRKLSKNLATERALREFAHNINLIMMKRGTLDDIAGYAAQMQSADIDAVFEGQKLVLEAAQVIEQRVNQELASNNWIVPQGFMQTDPEYGGSKFDFDVLEILMNRHSEDIKNKVYKEWEIRRAFRLAKGIQLGATAVILDRLGEADPPPTAIGAKGTYNSYFGEGILSAWDIMRHFFYRWEQPNDMQEIIYNVINTGGTLGTWDHDRLKEIKRELDSKRGSERREYLEQLGGQLFIEMRNMWGVGGLFTRGGWRTEGASYNLLVPMSAEEVEKNKLKGLVDVVGLVEREGGIRKNLIGIDWGKSWINFQRAGGVIMYNWADTRAQNEVRAEHKISADMPMDAGGIEGALEKGKITKQQAEELEKYADEAKDKAKTYKKEAFKHIKRVNPLKFAFFEKEDMYTPDLFAKSIRGRTIRAVFGSHIQTITQAKAEAGGFEKAEANIMVVQAHALQQAWERFDAGEPNPWHEDEAHPYLVEEKDFDIIPDAKERAEAIKYFKALTQAVDSATFKKTTPGKGLGKDEVKEMDAVSFFAQQDYAFSIGSEDLDVSQLRYSEGGANIIGRVWGDAKALGAGSSKVMGLAEVLVSAGQTHKYDHLIELIKESTAPIEQIHGSARKSKTSRLLATEMIRYYQKDFQAKLFIPPFDKLQLRLQRKFGYVSKSQEVQGLDAWIWEENETRQFIDLLRANNLISIHDRDILIKEVGARSHQLMFDVGRSMLLMVVLLIMLQAISQGIKEEK